MLPCGVFRDNGAILFIVRRARWVLHRPVLHLRLGGGGRNGLVVFDLDQGSLSYQPKASFCREL